MLSRAKTLVSHTVVDYLVESEAREVAGTGRTKGATHCG